MASWARAKQAGCAFSSGAFGQKSAGLQEFDEALVYFLHRGFYYNPRINKALLEKYHEGLICLSACVKGEIPHLLRNGRKQQAREAVQWYLDLFGEDYYLEIQDHGLEIEAEAMPQVIELAKEMNVPLVLTNDCHYLHQEDHEAHDILLCIQTQKHSTIRSGCVTTRRSCISRVRRR